jgi:UDP-N-acetylmuramoyl-L-alanyl-D-glutamate--2,6-diaminopimelate ligase
MKLSVLIKTLSGIVTDKRYADADPEVTALCYDSRRVVPGALFVAVAGFSVDGHRFIPDAVDRGAVAVVCGKPVQANVAVVQVSDPRAALARLAVRFYFRPAEQMTLVGVTGTSGKTTVTYLLEGILEKAGYRPGVVGTINYRYAGKVFDNPVTTPESADLQHIFRQMVNLGTTHAVMEVSSHALDLSRVDGCRFDLAVFTNLSHDHLDYHKDIEDYWRCKRRLFVEYLKPADRRQAVRAVVNTDDPKGRLLAEMLGAAALCSAAKGAGDIAIRQATRDLTGLRGIIRTPQGDIEFNSPLVGDFNLDNILSATGAALALGIAPAAIAAGIHASGCVPGRLERIMEGGERFVFVDYSHKPDALDNALGALRKLTRGRLITVFGCGGDRDSSKRPVMGEIAARLSDLTVVTSDNPRSEDPLAIIDQVEAGVRKAGGQRIKIGEIQRSRQGSEYLVEPDRRSAIRLAIRAARKGDAVLIAGKGHETYQILADRTIHFDDREVAREILTDMQGTGGQLS